MIELHFCLFQMVNISQNNTFWTTSNELLVLAKWSKNTQRHVYVCLLLFDFYALIHYLGFISYMGLKSDFESICIDWLPLSNFYSTMVGFLRSNINCNSSITHILMLTYLLLNVMSLSSFILPLFCLQNLVLLGSLWCKE